MSSNSSFDYNRWLAENPPISTPQWYDELSDPDSELRQSRPVDIRRVKLLALREVEKKEQGGMAGPGNEIQQETAHEFDSDDDFDINNDDGEDNTVYGGLHEKYNPQAYSTFSKNFMAKLGYDVNDPDLFAKNPGLGKENNGISTPIQGDLSRWGTTAGLGSITAMKQVKHAYKKPNIELKIPVVWIPRLDEEQILMPPSADLEDFSLNEDTQFNSPSTWCGLRVKTISYTDTTYCPLDVQIELFSTKSQFDDVGNDIFLDARNRSNPYELLKREYFQNRAALKMAELDAECGYIFTNPPCYQAQNKLYPAPYYWGDVCAGPGGFSEFISTVIKWKGKGFGFTLKAENDFQLEKFNQCSTPQTFQAFYGDGTGDVTRTANLISYSNEVFQGTGGSMLHVMMADGGFSVAGKENYQELLSRQLLLCQCCAGLLTLRKGGVCVIKMFDNFLRFTIDCIYLMRLAFEDVAVVKPHQSRPANSERYLVCKGLRQQGGVNHPIAAYMLRVNDMMNQLDPLHQQSGLVQSAETKPLLFLSAGILAGAQFDGNRDVDEDGNIIDVSEQHAAKMAAERIRMTSESENNHIKKRSRGDFNNGEEGSRNNNDDYYYNNDNNDNGEYYGNDDENPFIDHHGDGDCLDTFLDDPFAIEYLDLPSVFSSSVEQRCYDAGISISNNTIRPGYNKYDDIIPPEPRIDKELLRQQHQYVSSDIYTDKYKNEEKKKKLLKQQGKYQTSPEEDQYTFSMKDIIITGQTIHSLVPLKHHDQAFKAYILEWNQSYALLQIQWLRRVLQYIQDASLPTDDQDRIRVQCLQRWRIVIDQKNESGDGMVHWSPIWGKLWADPSYLLQSDLKSTRLFADLTSFSQQLIDKMNELSLQSGVGTSGIATDSVVTSSIMNQQQIQAILGGGQSMASFTSIQQVRQINDSRRMGGPNAQHAMSLMQRGDNLFGNNPRFSSQYSLYTNFCKYIYYNTHCVDMAYALKLIGLDLQYLPYAIRLADLKNDSNFRALRGQLTKILTHWFKFINKQRPILSPPNQPPIQDGNVVLETRQTYQTTSTNWSFLPIHAKAKRCVALTLTPDKRHASFNKTLVSVIFPHHHLTLTSPQGLISRIGGGLNFADQNSYKTVINPLLSQILTSNRDVFGGEDQCGDGPFKRFEKSLQQQQQQQQQGQGGEQPKSTPFYPPANFSTQDMIQNFDGILRSELNTSKEHQFMKQNIQHDISTGLLKMFPGDMIFDCFINLDIPPPISSAFLTRQSQLSKSMTSSSSSSHLPAQQSLSQIPVPTPRFRTTIYDSWSLPHQTGTKNLERYMYERLPYTDRFQNLKILADTMRVKEVALPLQFNSSVSGGFQGQDIKTKKLLYHSRHQLSQLNRNQNQFQGANSTSTLTINQLTTSTPNPHQFPSSLEFTRAYDLMDWMKDPFALWNRKASPSEKSKDNLFMFQKGHKLYSLSIWLALFTYTSHPIESLTLGTNQQVHQRRLEWFKTQNIAPQSQQEVGEVYQLLKLLQQKAICDAIAAVWLPPPSQSRPPGK